jgi:hypothetical protein
VKKCRWQSEWFKHSHRPTIFGPLFIYSTSNLIFIAKSVLPAMVEYYVTPERKGVVKVERGELAGNWAQPHNRLFRSKVCRPRHFGCDNLKVVGSVCRMSLRKAQSLGPLGNN